MAGPSYQVSPTSAAPVPYSLTNQSGPDNVGINSESVNARIANDNLSAFKMQGLVSEHPYQEAVSQATSLTGTLGVSRYGMDAN